jgi:hypothetical protein
LVHLMVIFFAIFYFGDSYLASRDEEALQCGLGSLVGLFECQTMICTPGCIRNQLPARSCNGDVSQPANGMPTTIKCRHCVKVLKASSLGRHLAGILDIYQETVVAKHLLEVHPTVTYTISKQMHGSLACLSLGCKDKLRNGWIMRWHFWDVHPMNLVKVP